MEVIQSQIRRNQKIGTYINSKIRRRLLIYMIILAVLAWLSIYHLIINTLALQWVIGWLVLWMILGWLAARMYKLSRNEIDEEVVSKMDVLWWVFLIIYIMIELNKKRIFWHRIHWPMLQTFGLVFLTGIFIGRLHIMAFLITKILHANDKLPIKS